MALSRIEMRKQEQAASDDQLPAYDPNQYNDLACAHAIMGANAELFPQSRVGPLSSCHMVASTLSALATMMMLTLTDAQVDVIAEKVAKPRGVCIFFLVK